MLNLFYNTFLFLFPILILITKQYTDEIFIKLIKFLSFWYSKIVLRFFKDNEKTLYRNLERSTLKLEKKKSHLMFNETCCKFNIKTKKVYTQRIHWIWNLWWIYNVEIKSNTVLLYISFWKISFMKFNWFFQHFIECINQLLIF